MPRTGSSQTAGARATQAYELRMRDLVRESGLPRQTIHFYLSAGLLPPPLKTGRNTALYSREHLERLHLIKHLQERQFLPLKAIRSLFEERPDQDFSDEQRALLDQLRVQLAPDFSNQTEDRLAVAEVVRKYGTSREELEEFEEVGVIEIRGEGSRQTIAREDAELIRLWRALEDAGISRERGFRPADFVLIQRAVTRFVDDEVELFSRNYAGEPPGTAAEVLRRAIPILNQILGIVHWKKMRNALTGIPGATNER